MGWWLTAWRDERSLRAHRNTLGHLQQVAGEDGSTPTHPDHELIPHVRVLGSPKALGSSEIRGPSRAGRGADHPGPLPPPAPLPAPAPLRPRAPVSPLGSPISPPPPPPASSAPPGRAADARRRYPRGGRRWTRAGKVGGPMAIGGAVVAAVAVAAIAFSGIFSGNGGARSRLDSRPSAPLTTARRAAPGLPATPAPQTPQTQQTPPPSAPVALLPSSTRQSGATYTVTTSSVELSLSAANRCWVELRSVSASGPVVYTGVLTAGSVRSFAGPGLWLRLGFPEAVRIEVDGRPITLPASVDPYDITVQSAPA